jgi:hypothetical protein
VRACSTLAVALLVPCLASADDAAPTAARAQVVVDLEASETTPAWFASAFEQTIARELAGFERISVVSRSDLPLTQCGRGDRDCAVAAYRTAGVDVVLFGTVAEGAIDYELFQTWTPARLATGAIEVGRGQSLVGLQHAAHDALHPVLKHGGLLDQRLDAGALAVPRTDRARWSSVELAVFAGVAAALALPFLVLALAGGGLGALAGRRMLRPALAVIGAIGLAIAVLDPEAVADRVATWPWLAAGLGGLGWGVFLLGVVRFAFPPLDGLARVALADLGRVLTTWGAACLERLVGLAVLYAPVAWLVVWLGGALAIPDLWTFFLVAPASALVARLVFAAVVECAAALLDRRLVLGPATADSPWGREVSDYLIGYVRRTGWDLDPALLARIRFLPGRPGTRDGAAGASVPTTGAAALLRGGPGVVAYGGGATHARIVIELPLLEMAMGPLVDVKAEDKPALWPDWTVASAVPHPGARPRRALTTAEAFHVRKQRTRAPGVPRKPLGQPATLLGWVVPAPGQLVPLISDNPQDLAVVRELLSEHYPWFAPDPDDEFDATDPTDKDLLFGALVRELGAVRRGETRFETVKLLFGPRVARIASPFRTRLADGYAAVNFALHPLVQYLHHRWSGATELLTARGRGPAIASVSRKLLRDVAASTEGKRDRALRARLVWLSRFFPQPIPDRRRVIVRRVVIATLGIGAVAAAGVAIKRSIDYHPTYVDRIQAQERDLAAARDKANQEKGPSDGEAPQATPRP